VYLVRARGLCGPKVATCLSTTGPLRGSAAFSPTSAITMLFATLGGTQLEKFGLGPHSMTPVLDTG
jgi:hypothetical protein